MIAPRPNQKLLTERPSPSIPAWMRLVAPVVSLFRAKQRDDVDLNRKLQSLLSAVTKCDNRQELEEILGAPSYAMIGEQFGQTSPDGVKHHPDLVECYARGRMSVELWFRNSEVWQTVGYLMPTSWDFVCGIEP